jgi:hypothetical protein
VTWVRLDDHFFMHPKVLSVGPAAAWLWAASIGYANTNLTDGFIPAGALPMLAMSSPAKSAELAAKLVAARLWDEAEGGYRIHDYSDWNPSAAEVRAKRQANTDRVQKHRAGTKVPPKAAGNAPVTRYTPVAVTPPYADVTPPLSFSSPSPTPDGEKNTPLPPRAEGEGLASKAKTPTDRERVFAEWCRVMDSPRSKIDKKRAARIDWALATYGLEVCTQAIAGCRADPFSMGQNDRGRKFNDATLIFRDAEHVEKFAALAPKPAPTVATVAVVPIDPELLAQNEELRRKVAAIAAQKQRERDAKFALVHPEAANA